MKGHNTTVGPASFREAVQNKIHPDSDLLQAKAGRPPKVFQFIRSLKICTLTGPLYQVHTGKRGRPPSGKVSARCGKVPKRVGFTQDLEEKKTKTLSESEIEDDPQRLTLSPLKTRAARKALI